MVNDEKGTGRLIARVAPRPLSELSASIFYHLIGQGKFRVDTHYRRAVV